MLRYRKSFKDSFFGLCSTGRNTVGVNIKICYSFITEGKLLSKLFFKLEAHNQNCNNNIKSLPALTVQEGALNIVKVVVYLTAITGGKEMNNRVTFLKKKTAETALKAGINSGGIFG